MSIVFYSCVVTSHDISRGHISLDRSDHHGCSVSHITSVIMDVSVTHIAAVIMHLGFAVKTPSNLRGGCPCRTVARLSLDKVPRKQQTKQEFLRP